MIEMVTMTDAKYTEFNSSIYIKIDGVETMVPLDPINASYQEIMRRVKAGELTIADAD
tara:strand:+ start:556 stop:729 length:174 start_codon:yes stop_codon:yes gene_type:complete